MQDNLRPVRLHLAIVATALAVAASAAHAFTMDTMTNPDGGARYADPADRLQDMGKGKTTDQQGSGLQLNVGPSSGLARDRFGPSSGAAPSNRIGAPPDQSRFNDR
jgi:hypothetical protein